MADLLSYQGNAGLGFGSSPGTPTIGPDNLKVINDTGRDIMLLDAEKNMKLFQQRIKDRDTLSALILQNQVSTGEILPEYLPEFTKAKEASEKAFGSWKGNFNDIKGFKEYEDSITNLQHVAAHAQVKTKMLHELEAQRAATTLPSLQKEMDTWIGKQKEKGFWEHVDPFQQMYNFNIDHITSAAVPVKTEMTNPTNPLFKDDVTFFDYGDILRRTQNGWLNDADITHSVDNFFSQWDRYDEPQKKKAIEAINGQIDKYNQEVGALRQGQPFQPGHPGYVDPVKLVDDGTGKSKINEPTMSFAAKYALSLQPQYVTRTPKFNKELATYGLGLKKLELEGKKLNIEAGKAKAYINNLNVKTDKWLKDNKNELTNIVGMYDDFINNMKPAGIDVKEGGKKTGSLDAVFLDQLPANYQYINGPIMGVSVTKDKSGKITTRPTGKIEVGKLDPFISSDGRPYYIPKYVNPQTGETIDFKSDYLKTNYRDSKKNGFTGDYDDYVRTLLKKGGLEMVLTGKNGTANYTSMSQSAKALNAIGTTKGEENIENPPAPIGGDDNIPGDQ